MVRGPDPVSVGLKLKDSISMGEERAGTEVPMMSFHKWLLEEVLGEVQSRGRRFCSV